MVQFNHRNMAYITVLVSWRVLYVVMKSRIGGMATVAALLAVSLVNYQALSGIITLLGLAERKKASMHQMTAMVTFTSVLLMIFLARGRGRKVVNAL